MNKIVLVIIGVFFLITSVQAEGAAKKDASPYPLYPELYKQTKEAIENPGEPQSDKSKGKKKQSKRKKQNTPPPLGKNAVSVLEDIDKVLAEVTVDFSDRQQIDKLSQLLCLRSVLDKFSRLDEKEISLFLLDHPFICSRFLQALDDQDDTKGALGVLKKIRSHDEKRFLKYPEFCIAFAVVWDDYHPYHWVEAKNGLPPADHMMELYEFFIKTQRRMLCNAWELPNELSIFVVPSPVTAAERNWALQTYARQSNAASIYSSVPWTKKLSPAHKTGAGLDYTLMNMKKHGGVCMEQAYFTEQVFRLRGVPAAYMRGQGARAGGHAWCGVFQIRQVKWDFSAGRYDNDRYYKGTCFDPTARRSALLESEILMTAAIFGNKNASMENIVKSNYFMLASWWAFNHLPDEIEKPKPMKKMEVAFKLMEASQKINPFNSMSWFLMFWHAQEKNLTPEQGMFWARKLSDSTLTKFPDFTVMGIGRLLDCVGDNDLKIKLYERLYNALKKARPDLASDIKVAEGGEWLEKGDIKRAIQCYIYPMVNFSKDNHVLGQAKKNLENIDQKADEKKVEKACVDILKVLFKYGKTPEQIEARNIILKKLISIYEKRGDDARVAQLKKSIVKVPKRE